MDIGAARPPAAARRPRATSLGFPAAATPIMASLVGGVGSQLTSTCISPSISDLGTYYVWGPLLHLCVGTVRVSPVFAEFELARVLHTLGTLACVPGQRCRQEFSPTWATGCCFVYGFCPAIKAFFNIVKFICHFPSPPLEFASGWNTFPRPEGEEAPSSFLVFLPLRFLFPV